MTAPRYEIQTVSDFLKVPEDRREICLREFAVWVDLVANIKALFGDLPHEGDPAWAKFIWVDDDKGTATITVKAGDEVLWSAEGRM